MIKNSNLIIFVFLFLSIESISQIEPINIDSFKIQREILESNYEVHYNEFESLLRKLEEFGDIHQYVLERLSENRRTPKLHRYFPAYLSFLCSNMDSIYQGEIINLIKSNSIERSLAYPIVKSCLFETNEQTCKYLNSQNLEEKFIQTKSNMYESLIKLKIEMKCSM